MVDRHGVRYAIDMFRLVGPDAHFGGWVFAAQPIAEVALVIGADRHTIPDARRDSRDVEAAFGPAANRCRFLLNTPLGPDIDLRAIADAHLEVRIGGEWVALPIVQCGLDGQPRSAGAPAPRPLSRLRFGIGVTTFNRRHILHQTLERIRRHTRQPHILVAADDGSTDGTRESLDAAGVGWVGGPNRGVAWNKNRALFHLHAQRACDVVLLLEDDTYPNEDGWESDWILGATAYGHVNFCPPWLAGHTSGQGNWHAPYVHRGQVSGQCSAFSAQALAWAGYMDARFGRYGYEHAEHTIRLIRAGYGGCMVDQDEAEFDVLSLDKGIAVADSISSHTAEAVAHNAKVFGEVVKEGGFRPAWSTEAQRMALMQELSAWT